MHDNAFAGGGSERTLSICAYKSATASAAEEPPASPFLTVSIITLDASLKENSLQKEKRLKRKPQIVPPQKSKMFIQMKAASMAEMMSIFKMQKAVSAKLDGCSNYCIPGATGGLSVSPRHR